MISLTTRRLCVRRFRESDGAALHAYLSLPETYRYEPGGPVTLDEACALARERSQGEAFLAVALLPGDGLIGHVYLGPTEAPEFATHEVGYIFHPAYQGQGYATEAVAAVVDYAFREMRAHRVVGNCNPENAASWRVLEKCGMTREATFRQNVFFRRDPAGEPLWTDTYVYAILRRDWETVPR